MKKYEIYCDYDNKDEKYVAVSREFFGLIIYADTEQELNKSILATLKVYAKDNNISGKNIKTFFTKAYRKHVLTDQEDSLQKEQGLFTF